MRQNGESCPLPTPRWAIEALSPYVTEPLTTPEAKAWLARHLANAPKRSPEWVREVAAIYAAGRADAARARAAAAQAADTEDCPTSDSDD
jgi:hypothetical protein